MNVVNGDNEEGNYQTYQSPSSLKTSKNNNVADVEDDVMEGGRVAAGIFSSSSSTSKKPTTATPRLIHRNLPFHQSKNYMNVGNKYGSHRDAAYRLFRLDWFHVFLRLHTLLSVTILLLIWTVQILIFAALYVAVDSRNPKVDCGLGVVKGIPMTYTEAFAFSLETVTTVGYTLPGKFFFLKKRKGTKFSYFSNLYFFQTSMST